jgi:hypothetical protein
LVSHPGVQIISRDRGDDYAKGATDAAEPSPPPVTLTRAEQIKQANRH